MTGGEPRVWEVVRLPDGSEVLVPLRPAVSGPPEAALTDDQQEVLVKLMLRRLAAREGE